MRYRSTRLATAGDIDGCSAIDASPAGFCASVVKTFSCPGRYEEQFAVDTAIVGTSVSDRYRAWRVVERRPALERMAADFVACIWLARPSSTAARRAITRAAADTRPRGGRPRAKSVLRSAPAPSPLSLSSLNAASFEDPDSTARVERRTSNFFGIGSARSPAL